MRHGLELTPIGVTVLHAQVFELWIEPELARRGGRGRSKVRVAAVLMTDPPTVPINNEVDIVATAPQPER